MELSAAIDLPNMNASRKRSIALREEVPLVAPATYHKSIHNRNRSTLAYSVVADESETSTVMMNVGKRRLARCGWLIPSAPATSSLPRPRHIKRVIIIPVMQLFTRPTSPPAAFGKPHYYGTTYFDCCRQYKPCSSKILIKMPDTGIRKCPTVVKTIPVAQW